MSYYIVAVEGRADVSFPTFDTYEEAEDFFFNIFLLDADLAELRSRGVVYDIVEVDYTG